MFTSKTICQVTTNKYEVEIDKLLAEKNPEYYDGLKDILSEFQKSLISKSIIVDSTFKSYVRLLKQISEDDKLEFDITYDLNDSLEGLGEGLFKVIPSIESAVIGQNYLNINNSKDFLFNQKVSEMVKNGQELNRSKFANLILEIYDEKDFKLPLIKLKVFRFLDPNSDYDIYIYAGRPNPE